MEPTLLYFDDEAGPAARLADAAGFSAAAVARHRFPDGELRLRLPERLPPDVVIFRSLYRPNEKLIELLLTARTAHQLGARRLSLVSPYLAYMRQDIAFNPGEAISQRVVGAFLADLFDDLVTIDPHLHRIHSLDEAIPLRNAVALSGAPMLATLIAQHRTNPLLVGPDAESEQWVAQAAASHGWDSAVCSKQRHGDREVDVALPTGLAARNREVVLIDDVASSGHTLARAAAALLAAGAASVDVAVTHALFADDALSLVHRAGVSEVWSTDCIPHPSNALAVAPMLAEALRAIGVGQAT